MEYFENILGTIGNTPLVKLNKLTKDLPCLVLAKYEALNPGNSTKDRMALKMIEDAEKQGLLKVSIGLACDSITHNLTQQEIPKRVAFQSY